MLWRRSYDVPPPPLADDDPYSPVGDPRYALLPSELMPRTECLKDVLTRLMPYWHDVIIPDLAADATVLVVAHGNSLRALVKHLDGISDEEIAGLNIPTGIPLVYEIGADFRPKERGGRYLDPQAAAAAAEAVANQQLIFDLKNVNPRADVSAKLVSEVGVGTVAAGVAKARS